MSKANNITFAAGKNITPRKARHITIPLQMGVISVRVMIMADGILRYKSKEFAKKIVFLCRGVKAKNKESVLINQLLRSGTRFREMN